MMNGHQHEGQECRHRRPSSFHMQDPNRVFAELGLKEGTVFLDVGSGAGDYSLRAATLVGDSGRVYALDRSRELVDELMDQAAARDLPNITTMVANATRTLPIPDACIDVCLVATVLHTPEVAAHARSLFAEIHRVLVPGGTATVIECSSKDLSYGPPADMRLTPDKVGAFMSGAGLGAIRYVDLGFNYMVTASKTPEDNCNHPIPLSRAWEGARPTCLRNTRLK